MEEDGPVVINPNDGKWKLFFSLCARVLCLPDHCRGLYYHHALQVSHSVLSNSHVERWWKRSRRGRGGLPSWLSAIGAMWTACEA